jgi:hypothetical protein
MKNENELKNMIRVAERERENNERKVQMDIRQAFYGETGTSLDTSAVAAAANERCL